MGHLTGSRRAYLKRSPIKRKTRIKPVNRERKRKRYAEAFGDKAEFVRHTRCVVCGQHEVDPHHVKSRGAGGTSEHLVGLCREHHTELHTIGRQTFEDRHNIDLTLEALEMESQWQHFRGTGELEF